MAGSFRIGELADAVARSGIVPSRLGFVQVIGLTLESLRQTVQPVTVIS